MHGAAAQVLTEVCTLAGGRVGIDVIVCEVAANSCWHALEEAQELVQQVRELSPSC